LQKSLAYSKKSLDPWASLKTTRSSESH